MKTGGIVMISALAVALPIVVIIIGGKLMLEVSGRDRVVQSIAGKAADFPKPLQSRLGGYDPGEAKTYFEALGEAGRAAESRLLNFDLLFPVLYGAALAFSVMTLWSAHEFRIHLAWFLIPVILAVVADWIETTILLQQLNNFGTSGSVNAGPIQTASFATIVKSWSILLSAVLIISLSIALFFRSDRPDPRQAHSADTHSIA